MAWCPVNHKDSFTFTFYRSSITDDRRADILNKGDNGPTHGPLNELISCRGAVTRIIWEIQIFVNNGDLEQFYLQPLESVILTVLMSTSERKCLAQHMKSWPIVNFHFINVTQNLLWISCGSVVPVSEHGYFVASWWRTPLCHPAKVTIDQQILFSTNFRYSCASGGKKAVIYPVEVPPL
jgi:hypothetical protein